MKTLSHKLLHMLKLLKTIIQNRNTWVSLFYYLLVFIGFIMFLLFIYFNFMRARLPKDIPLELTEFRFYSLLFLCCIYIYTIKMTLYPKIPSKLVLKVSYIMFEPLSYFYSYLKKKFYSHIYTIKKYVYPILDDWDFYANVFLIYIMQIFPRILLLLIFLVDVFYLHYLEIFYYFIIIGIIPLLHHLFIYFLQHTLEESIENLEKKYKRIWVLEKDSDNITWEHNPKAHHHNTNVSVRQYIDIQYEVFITYGDNDEYITYYGEPFCTEIYFEEYIKKYNKIDVLDFEDYKHLRIYFEQNIPNILLLKRFLELNKKTANACYIPEIKLFILIMYFVSWLYILGLSFHTLNGIPFTLNILELLEHYSPVSNPFSELSYILIGFTTIHRVNNKIKNKQKHHLTPKQSFLTEENNDVIKHENESENII